ncbi:MAG: hypothetical protein NC489_36195 [Ruminococcus flavefaciens]|nr:hypothetical protein [Ruminococcus flavefaciens]
MKLEDMVMVVENRKGTETNYLLNLTDYMEAALKLWGEHAEDMAGAIGTLYETKAGATDWSDLYFAADKSIHAAFCRGESQLRGFLAGNFNDGEWSFDTESCSEDCLEVLRIYNMKPDGQPLFPYLHYERVEHTFHAGEVLRNMNGNDYRVLAALSPKNLLLMSMADSQIIVGRGVQMYERYPKGERPDNSSMVTGIEWDHGVYLGADITRIDFDILKQEYGEPDRAENVSDLRDMVRKDFWMQKNVEQKERLPYRVRNAARDCLEDTFGTNEPDVFDKMLDKGMYDGMYHAKEERKQISGQSR